MRISVMELGRFTAAQQMFPGEWPEDSLIILHGGGERNHRKPWLRHEGSQLDFRIEVRGLDLFWSRRHGSRLRLLGDDLILDLVVSRLRDDLFVD